MLDFQFEVLTTHLNDGGQEPRRSNVNNAHAYLGAPYGIYRTIDGYLAVAMGSVTRLGELLDCEPLTAFSNPKTWFTHRDEIKAILADHLKTRSTQDWLDRLVPADYWCAPVMTWSELLEHDAFHQLDFLQEVTRSSGARLTTTRCPITINGDRLRSALGAPKIGEHTIEIDAAFGL
jgi:crotonobetainyl-CoA:carnitine CoA-transferase CaiB-like acyl-CoA transferase